MNNGILFNWSVALGAWAIGGPLWATIAFLSVALIRVSLASKDTRDESSAVQRRLELLSSPMGFEEESEAAVAAVPPPPSSEKRTVSGTIARVRAAS